jgi:molecular chaperone Hsp33
MSKQDSTGQFQDSTRKFVFEQADIRGEIVHLDAAYADITAIHQYAPGVTRLLGEFLAAAVLLSTTIKFEGRLILQAQSEGEIPLLMAECSNQLQIRAIARGAEQANATEFSELLREGQLAITIEPANGQRYQGIVPLTGDNLSAAIEHYFENSEQLPTRLWLASDGERAAGLLLQQLPAQVTPDLEERSAQWQHSYTLADTISAEEVLETEQEQLLYRLFHQDSLRLFTSQPVSFCCSCSLARCRDALLALGTEELEDLLAEAEPITIDCEFCNQQYLFGREDLLTDPLSTPLH